MKKTFLTLAFSLLLTPAFAKDIAPENLMIIGLPGGDVQVELLPERAPKTVEQIRALVRSGFYNNLEWFRVIDGFIAQTGYPKGSKGKSKFPDLQAEFTDYKFKRGTLGMGHGEDINSANSQFFICTSDAKCAELTGKYTAFGQVISGMEFVDQLAKGEPPAEPDKTGRIRIGADSEVPERAKSFGND